MIAAIVLSAGKSERMGSPKALLQYRGRSFLQTILDAIASARIDHRIVVAGHHYEAIVRAFPNIPVILNPDFEKGMSTSVQAGIRALPAGLTGAGIFLVDHPMIDHDTIDTLVNRLEPGRIVVPVHAGRRGHPVLFAADLFSEILDLPYTQGLNSIVNRDRARVVEVSVASAGILRDIDTPEQFAKLAAEDC